MIRQCLILILTVIASVAGCSGRISSNIAQACSVELSAAERELDKAKADGLGDAVSITKAMGLITAAAFQKQIERYESCYDKARRARAYIEDAGKH